MQEVIQGAGLFFWLLLPCSLLSVYIFAERWFALRDAAVSPASDVERIFSGKLPDSTSGSVVARLARSAADPSTSEEALVAQMRLEINRMERGFVFLEFIVGAAPMVGLMGTVVALMRVFGAISPAAGAAAQGELTQGISLALSATFLGLLIAVPSLFFVGYLQRRVESHAARLETLIGPLRALASRQP